MNVVIIPSLNPNQKLITIIQELQNSGLSHILIVDDGSVKKDLYDQIEKKSIPVIHHPTNLGKGEALKTGIKESSNYYDHITGYIFMDSDGQHLIQDVVQCNDKSIKTNHIVLGVRDFTSKNVPLRSRIGNKISSIIFYLRTGHHLEDTQTGLRVIPIQYRELLLTTPGNRYEYEMNFLNELALQSIPFDTVPINTVYEDHNKESHFNTVKDSYRIYEKPIKFILSSFTSFLIDILSFQLLLNVFPIVFISNVLSRVISGYYNYNLNKYWCFKKYSKTTFYKYFTLFLIQMFLSSTLVELLSTWNNHYVLIKIIVDFSLFIGSYFIQKNLVFKERRLNEKL